MDSQKTSIDNQVDIFRHYAAQQNWEIVKIYIDKKSGIKNNRPGLKALIEDGKAGVYDVILAKELSRLARNGGLSYELRDICQMHDIHIVCLDNYSTAWKEMYKPLGYLPLPGFMKTNQPTVADGTNRQNG